MRLLHTWTLRSAIAARVALALAVVPHAPRMPTVHLPLPAPVDKDWHAPPGDHQPMRLNSGSGAKSAGGAHHKQGSGPAKEGGADGQGLARKFSQVKPMLRVVGNVSRGGHPVNLVEEHGFHKQLGGSFSLMCTLRMNFLNPWQRIFDFSFKADIDSITAGAIENTTNLHFTVFKGKTQKSVHVQDFFEPGKRATALFTVSKAGRMRVWKDGELAGEIEGHAPYFNDRPHLMIGGHYFYKKQYFRGVIGNVKIWNKEVIWPPRPGVKPFNFARQPVLAHTWGVVAERPTAKPPEAVPSPVEHVNEFAQAMQKKLESAAALADAKAKQREQSIAALFRENSDGQEMSGPMFAGPPMPPQQSDGPPMPPQPPSDGPPMPPQPTQAATSAAAAPVAGRPPEPRQEAQNTITVLSPDKPAADRSASTRWSGDLGALVALCAAAVAASH